MGLAPPAREKIPPLADFVHELSPQYAPPYHLKPFIELLERAVAGEQVEAVIHAPPRHGKTETCLHFLPWALLKRPSLMLGYVTYGDRLANSKSRRAIGLAERAGVKLVTRNVHQWRNEQGGGVIATSIRGPYTGEGYDIGVIDDPTKDRLQAESPVMREANKEWLHDVFLSRAEPGASKFIFATRWHPDDLSGHAISELGWQYICLPAISDAGEALWPSRWPLKELVKKEREAGPYTWASLYQGKPRRKGGRVFQDVWTYSGDLSTLGPMRVAIGLDFAYTESTHAHYSVALALAELESKPGQYFILDVFRDQIEAGDFANVLKLWRRKYPGGMFFSYLSSTEQGIAQLLGRLGVYVEHRLASGRGDKFIRAQPVSVSWNLGSVFVPERAPWLDQFIVEVCDFTGVQDVRDDQVDALSAAYDRLQVGYITEPATRVILPKRRI